MLQTEIIIEELDQYLQSSGLYYADDENAEMLSADINEKWSERFSEAIKNDFFEHSQLKVSLYDNRFELFGDRGTSVWWTRIVVEDGSSLEKLSFGFKAILNYKKNRLALDENSIRLESYPGINISARNLFRKMKDNQLDGYESTITIRKLLLE